MENGLLLGRIPCPSFSILDQRCPSRDNRFDNRSPVSRPLHTLKIVPFANRSKTISFRVTGFVLGERVRKNFPSRAEAEAYFDKRTAPLGAGLPKTAVLTTLPEPVVREVEVSLPKLPAGKSVADAIEFFRKHFKPLTPLTWPDATSRYQIHLIEERKTEQVTGEARAADAAAFGKFAAEHRCERTDGITAALCKAWIYAKGLEARSQRDRYDRVNQFVAWLVREHHATFNPVPDLIRPKVRVDLPAIFAPDQAQALLAAAWTDPEGPQMLPHFAITLLSGVRPGECVRLTDADLKLDSARPVIEVNKAKGGRSRRVVSISPQLAEILKKCRELKLSPGFFSKRKFDRIRRAAGVHDIWEKDISRHSYASYTYEAEHDIEMLVADMGNSAKVLFTYYIRSVSRESATAYRSARVDWSAVRRRTMEGRRVDLWAKLPREVLSPEQRRAVALYNRRRRVTTAAADCSRYSLIALIRFPCCANCRTSSDTSKPVR
jgi:integrase